MEKQESAPARRPPPPCRDATRLLLWGRQLHRHNLLALGRQLRRHVGRAAAQQVGAQQGVQARHLILVGQLAELKLERVQGGKALRLQKVQQHEELGQVVLKGGACIKQGEAKRRITTVSGHTGN
jgi:hypothetical protein